MITNFIHGHACDNKPSGTYRSWQAMIARCHRLKHPAYRKYTENRIVVCEEWFFNFEKFLADMGERPEGATLDRWPDNTGIYEPYNCRWTSASEQQRNKGNNRLYHLGEEKMTAIEIFETVRPSISYQALRRKLSRGYDANLLLT